MKQASKKTKHITINLTEDQYNYIVFLSNQYRRTETETATLILIDNAERLFIEVQRQQQQQQFKPAHFIPSNEFNEIKL